MKSTKVCIIAKYTYPLDTRLVQQANALIDRGIPCDVICANTDHGESTEISKFLNVYRVSKKTADKQSFFSYLISTVRFFTNAFLKLSCLSLKNNYKVIVVHTLPEFLVFMTMLNKIFGATIILDGRDITVDLISSRWSGVKTYILKKFAIIIERIIGIFCDEIITASNGFKMSLIDRGIYENKIKVMVNTADATIFRFDKKRIFKPIKENARFIYHGTVSERFGLIIAIKAMKSICHKIPGSILHVYGGYDLQYRRKIEECIEDGKLNENVILHNPVNLEEIYKQILTMDLGVVPYLSDNFMNLALSTKTFEYVASGLPVTASRLKSAEEIFDDSCIQYAKPGDVEDFTEKVVSFCLDPEARAFKRNQAASVLNEKYSSTLQGEMYVNMISQHLGIKGLIATNIK